MELVPLDEVSLYEYIFERYVELEANAADLSQDLGILSRSESELNVDIQPHHIVKKKKAVQKDEYSFTVRQSLTSLHSNRDNNNSTTGYVLWTTSTFILKWLLYNEHATLFTKGGVSNDVEVQSLFQCEQDNKSRYILELGTGMSPMFPIAFSNYVEKYVATDQKDILPRLKDNIQENQAECRRRILKSSTVSLENLKRRTELECELDVALLNWELFTTSEKAKEDPVLHCDPHCHLNIIAMDVIYNEYLIAPFLNTLQSLFVWYSGQGLTVSASIGIQLRTQDVLEMFLEEAIIEREFTVHAVNEEKLNQSRFILLHITLDH
ncbi:unnamed protein product [Kluyveromyces dobzhanskii CBS 2104]|uniref:Ribosomal lysine N-methyltransferase 5 n=1 Tax=Kluyveromyces dobzhanskii CBS 2104 TaxID=1427455 RepID=A0A0A8L717_9SACH|nr:unnamed protein product [Kluyveromyces dobzhanskii CBS 2104]